MGEPSGVNLSNLRDTLNYFFPQKRGELTPCEILALEGSTWTALLYSNLFLPETQVVDDVVFLKSWHYEDDAEFVAVRRKVLEFVSGISESDRRRRLSDFTWVELRLALDWDYYEGKDLPEMSDSCYNLLAQRVVTAWDAILHRRYPDRRFVVSVLSEEETTGSLGVMFEEVNSK